MSAVLQMDVLQSLPKAVEPAMKTSTLMTDAREVLLQGLTLLFDLDDHRYSKIAGAPFNASIGQHYRHVIEHFQSLTRGSQNGEINYDARERNVRLQSEVTYGSIATCDILRVLKRYTDETLALECAVINSVGYGSAGASKLIECQPGTRLLRRPCDSSLRDHSAALPRDRRQRSGGIWVCAIDAEAHVFLGGGLGAP